MARRYQTAIIVVTHDEKIIPTFRRIYRIRDGRTYEEAGEGRDPATMGAPPREDRGPAAGGAPAAAAIEAGA